MADADYTQPYGRIYLITNKVTGKVYVGQTIGTLAARWKGHRNSSRPNRLWNSIQVHGRDAFEIKEIATARTKSELNDLECLHIAEYRATEKEFGYNVERGGMGSYRGSDAIERAAQKLRGIPLSQEHRARISASKKGTKQTPQQVANMIAGKLRNKGFKHSEEAKRKMSQVAMGKKMPPCSEEYRKQASESMRRIWAERKASRNTI